MAPRLSASPRKNKPRATAPAPARPATIGDNSMHGEEAERVQLISFASQITAATAEVETAKAPFEAAKKKRKGIFDLAHAAGFTSAELNARMDEMKRTPAQNAEIISREGRHRKWLRIISDEQVKMHLEPGTPQEARDMHDWYLRGHTVGLLGLAAELPTGIPPRMDQPFLKGHGEGRAEYLAALKANVPGGKRLVREQAAADFKADNPEAPEPGTPEAAAAERKAIRAGKEALAKMGTGEPTNDPDAGFEATPDELAAQTPRQAVQDAREAEDPDTVPCPDCGAAAGQPCEPDCPSPDGGEVV